MRLPPGRAEAMAVLQITLQFDRYMFNLHVPMTPAATLLQ
jgi:hypothetical protein